LESSFDILRLTGSLFEPPVFIIHSHYQPLKFRTVDAFGKGIAKNVPWRIKVLVSNLNTFEFIFYLAQVSLKFPRIILISFFIRISSWLVISSLKPFRKKTMKCFDFMNNDFCMFLSKLFIFFYRYLLSFFIILKSSIFLIFEENVIWKNTKRIL